ncbi:uncharacterized protein Triagg1_7213 [Trichoderma aggressivum f. europaeum]|uniref:PH domain-containing protein n=1 Tax=Trichoderma aggressivum f. europaeum TaxID=173218 RepID=A0AAE1IDY3_9HYPO|nr:hypothetical protein Triagg1_7213 [Trichoderma aggressivum f. europaeum]
MAPISRPEPPEGNNPFPRRIHTPIPFLSGESDSVASSKPAKPGRRESRLGIRTLFGRSSRLHKGEESLRSPSSLNSLNSAKASPRSGGFRASLADMNWPYGQQVKSELALPMANYPWDSPREKPDDGRDAQSRSPANGAALAAAAAAAAASSGKRTPGMSIAKQPRPTLATWTLPTLFRAYQQAHKQQSLAAVSLPIEALMKLGEKTSVEIIAPLSQTDMNVSGSGGGAASTSTGDKFRRRNRGDSLSTTNLPWTTKIYILATAGYLLQYTGDGAIDRVPEKVLRLGKSSAAFATDLIPGRHWVLQVSATTEDDRVSTTESRSLLSKLSFRTSEKRYTSNMLMVFESAEDMDDWMTSLRAMIEQLGGKRSLSEAGLPKEFDSKETDSKESSFDGIYLREKKSQGNLIDKEAIRSTQVVAANPSPVLQQGHGRRVCDYSIPVIDFDSVTHDMTSDDKSTTNSVVSHDGRQLDNLRDSSHRLSLLSSGQRTILTSTTSSPADSPIRERFPLPADITTIPETAQPRPNGSVIMNRRVSLQTMAPFIGEIGDGMSELGQFPSPPWVKTEPPSPSDPRGTHGFGASSIQQVGRRYIKLTSALDPSGLPPSPTTVGPRVSLRKLSNIRTGRPLSTVEDQPSPKESAMPERPVTSHHAETRSQVSSADAPRVPKLPRGRLVSVPNVPQMLGRRLSLVHKESRSRSPGLQADGAQQAYPELRSTFEDDSPLASPVSEKLYHTLPSHIAAAWGDRVRRNRTSVEVDGESTRSFSLGFSWASRPKRASIASAFSEWSAPGDVRPIDTIAETPPLSPPPTGPLPPIPSSRPSSSCSNQAQMMGRKKSMPRMAMPPPAPPPTCALPPIPQKQTAQV